MDLWQRRAGAGEPLLLLHGLGMSGDIWQPTFERLARHHDVAAVDLPGFGRSSPLSCPPSPPALADAVEAHLDQLGWRRPHVAGNSLGGLIGLELGRRGRAGTVTAISPGGMAIGWEDRLARASLRSSRFVGERAWPLVRAVLRTRLGRSALLGTAWGRPGRLSPDEVLPHIEGFMKAPGTLAALDAFDDHDTIDRLDEVTCGVTIACGTRDRLLLPRQGPRFAAALPKARLVRMPGLGHMPMQEDPAQVVQVILATTGAR